MQMCGWDDKSISSRPKNKKHKKKIFSYGDMSKKLRNLCSSG